MVNVQPGCGITPNEQTRWIETSGLDAKPLGEAAFFLMLLAGAYFDVSN
jgi:hypothetical protein